MANCIRKDKVSLLPKNMETRLLLKYNTRAVCYSISMPKCPDDFIPRNDRIYDNLDSDME